MFLSFSINLSITFVLKTSVHQQQTLPSSISLHGTGIFLPSFNSCSVLDSTDALPILIPLAKKITMFLAVINLRRFVCRHALLFITIKTITYTLNYKEEERVEIKKEEEWGSGRGDGEGVLIHKISPRGVL
jgi:hypothetical protein